MDTDRIKGSLKQLSGSIKETAGRILGDKKDGKRRKDRENRRQDSKCRRQPEGHGSRSRRKEVTETRRARWAEQPAGARAPAPSPFYSSIAAASPAGFGRARLDSGNPGARSARTATVRQR